MPDIYLTTEEDHGRIRMGDEGYKYRNMFGSKFTRTNQREGVGKGLVFVKKQMLEGRGRFGWPRAVFWERV
jgi:hypothetical protein